MQISSQVMSQKKINSLKKSDEVTLAIKNHSGKTSYFKALIAEVTGDIPRCMGCSIRLDNKDSFKFKNGYYCRDCYRTRLSKQRTAAEKGVKSRKNK